MRDFKNKISLREQNRLLNKSLKNAIPLSEILAENGLTYDNLRYETYVNGFESQGHSESFDALIEQRDAIPSISFFSGAGGLDLGFKFAGFQNIASIENNEIFCDTLRLNNPNQLVIGPPYYSGDISSREELKDILENVVGIRSGFDGVFHGGPPCQPFSIASFQRFKRSDGKFKRNGFQDVEKGNLLFDYLWFIDYFLPRAFLIENVPGLEEMDITGHIKRHLALLSNKGYKITSPTVLNSANYGVPQSRRRLFIVGIRGSYGVDLPKPNLFQSSCFDIFQRDIQNLNNHTTRNHTGESIKRYSKLEFGMRDTLGRVDRLNPFLPSKTVIAGGTKGGGRSHLHPYSPRTLTVRESARLQTFPDHYLFSGPSARQFTQVGNAVPPLLGYKLAVQIKNKL